jgi:DNA polymerase/3'-5' exonuclease PolX
VNDEQQFNEIEKTMFDMSGACRRARRTIKELEKGKAPEHLAEAMRVALAEMEGTHKRLMQGTYWAVPEMREAKPEQTKLL